MLRLMFRKQSKVLQAVLQDGSQGHCQAPRCFEGVRQPSQVYGPGPVWSKEGSLFEDHSHLLGLEVCKGPGVGTARSRRHVGRRVRPFAQTEARGEEQLFA